MTPPAEYIVDGRNLCGPCSQIAMTLGTTTSPDQVEGDGTTPCEHIRHQRPLLTSPEFAANIRAGNGLWKTLAERESGQPISDKTIARWYRIYLNESRW